MKEKLTNYWIFCLVIVAIGAALIESSPKPRRLFQVGLTCDGRELLDKVNNCRRVRNLPPLARDERLEQEARSTARENAKYGRLKHAPIQSGGEIIAFNYSGFDQAVQQWEESTVGHREQLLSRKYRAAGCACVRRNGVYYSCVRFR